jgi:zinc transporter
MPNDSAFRVAAGRINLEHGLICGFALRADGSSRPIEISETGAAFAEEGTVVWLHFNAANAIARRWLANSQCVSAEFLQLVEEHETRVRISASASAVFGVITDLAFAERVDPSEVVTVWVYASQRLIVTARNHAAHTADLMRLTARQHLTAASGQALLSHLLEVQADTLRDWLANAAHELDHAEDQILIGHVSEQRENLGRIRRLAMHLRRHFMPQRVALQRLLSQPAEKRGAIDLDAWRTLHDDFSFAMDEATNVYERAKLLQEELSSRLAETTSRNLYMLTICTLVFLPMTLITGIFGMNVAGVPGVGDNPSSHAFWWVMLLMLFAGVVALLLLRLRRLF